MTLSPLRAARRSEGRLGNSSEGGSGGPIEAQPVNQVNAVAASNIPRSIFMCRNNRLHQLAHVEEQAGGAGLPGLRQSQAFGLGVSRDRNSNCPLIAGHWPLA